MRSSPPPPPANAFHSSSSPPPQAPGDRDASRGGDKANDLQPEREGEGEEGPTSSLHNNVSQMSPSTGKVVAILSENTRNKSRAFNEDLDSLRHLEETGGRHELSPPSHPHLHASQGTSSSFSSSSSSSDRSKQGSSPISLLDNQQVAARLAGEAKGGARGGSDAGGANAMCGKRGASSSSGDDNVYIEGGGLLDGEETFDGVSRERREGNDDGEDPHHLSDRRNLPPHARHSLSSSSSSSPQPPPPPPPPPSSSSSTETAGS
ncbi:hypothetical protein CSUI_001549, partial [Cystoisospora suis]